MLCTSKQQKGANCVTCAMARPDLGTSPFPLTKDNDPNGFQCLLHLFVTNHPPQNCTSIDFLFPPVRKLDLPPLFIPYPGNCSCITRCDTGGSRLASWQLESLTTSQNHSLESTSATRHNLELTCGGIVVEKDFTLNFLEIGQLPTPPYAYTVMRFHFPVTSGKSLLVRKKLNVPPDSEDKTRHQVVGLTKLST